MSPIDMMVLAGGWCSYLYRYLMMILMLLWCDYWSCLVIAGYVKVVNWIKACNNTLYYYSTFSNHYKKCRNAKLGSNAGLEFRGWYTEHLEPLPVLFLFFFSLIIVKKNQIQIFFYFTFTRCHNLPKYPRFIPKNKHGKNCESCQSQVPVPSGPVPSRPVPSRPVPSCPDHHDHHVHQDYHDQHDHHDHHDHHDRGDLRKWEVIWGSWMLFTRKLEVIWSDVLARSLWWTIINEWVSDIFRYIELLWQLKRW